eukprot:553285-Prorocentrum_minimum.AAC.1
MDLFSPCPPCLAPYARKASYFRSEKGRALVATPLGTRSFLLWRLPRPRDERMAAWETCSRLRFSALLDRSVRSMLRTNDNREDGRVLSGGTKLKSSIYCTRTGYSQGVERSSRPPLLSLWRLPRPCPRKGQGPGGSINH